MDPNLVINAFTCVGTLAIVIVSFCTATNAVKSSRELSKKQMQVSLFAECTGRFQEIKLHLKKQESDKEYYQRLYIDLCSEEFYLHSKGYLADDVWSIWKKGIEVTLEDDASYRNIWETDLEYYDKDFRKFFNDLVIEHTKRQR